MKHALLFSAVFAIASCDFVNHIFSDDFIEKTNQKAEGMWVAERGFHPKTSHAFLRDLMGVIKSKHHHHKLRKKVFEEVELNDLPNEFDPRVKWPMCPSIKDVLDQGSCGSCWAFGAASAMTDRRCIHSGGKYTEYVSAENLLSCCYACGFGCNGGFPGSAWKFWHKKGLVTGGKYGTIDGCQPYDIPPCEHHTNGTRPACKAIGPTPKCHRFCENTKYKKDYDEDKTYGQEPYEISKNPLHIMKELVTNGPMEVALTVYEDFVNYKSGVYKHVSGASLGGHAVRLLGWGEENGHPYWLVANSWNFDWGDKGLFKILRGSNECGIEESAIGSIPVV